MLKEVTKAMADFRKGLELDPQNQVCREGLARVEQSMFSGKRDEQQVRIQGLGRDFGFSGLSGFRIRVPGFGLRVSGFGLRVRGVARWSNLDCVCFCNAQTPPR